MASAAQHESSRGPSNQTMCRTVTLWNGTQGASNVVGASKSREPRRRGIERCSLRDVGKGRLTFDLNVRTRRGLEWRRVVLPSRQASCHGALLCRYLEVLGRCNPTRWHGSGPGAGTGTGNGNGS